MIVWLVGLSGAGKTTIGRIAVNELRSHGHPTVLLDGDEFREVIGQTSTYDRRDREINSRRMARFSLLLERNHVVVVACILSIFPEHRSELRRIAQDYIEVYVKADISDLLNRDYKRLYAKAMAGEQQHVVGVDIDFPEPVMPDLVIENQTNISDVSALGRRVAEEVMERLVRSSL